MAPNSTETVDGGRVRNSTETVDGGRARNSTETVDGGRARNSTETVDGGKARHNTETVDGGRARKGPFKFYVTQMGVVGGVRFSRKKRYEGVRFNVICVTRGWVGVQFPENSVT